jgi:pimeloyl-ACP methyl ester carboxylesterase
LLLYATGDGGWWRKDAQVFDELASWGYPVAGFSSRNYLKNLGYVADTTTPARLARDYMLLIDFSLASLGLPAGTPVVLVGVSRGAGLAVVAAGQRQVRDRLAGVLAVALTREEEYVKRYRTRREQAAGAPARELVTIETYDYLTRLAPLPVAVIQSSRDDYLPADKARQLFGPDTPTHRLIAVDARDHAFDGARAELYRQMERSLAWIASTIRREHRP